MVASELCMVNKLLFYFSCLCKNEPTTFSFSFRSSRQQRCSVTLLKKRPWHRSFPVNFTKFLRRAFWQNTSSRLLLLFPFTFSVIWRQITSSYYQQNKQFVVVFIWKVSLMKLSSSRHLLVEIQQCKHQSNVALIFSDIVLVFSLLTLDK